jgi:hypothetical protein
MKWRIVPIKDDEAMPGDLTSGELVGVSILLTHKCGEPRDEHNVYWRAREKMQPQVEQALNE